MQKYIYFNFKSKEQKGMIQRQLHKEKTLHLKTPQSLVDLRCLCDDITNARDVQQMQSSELFFPLLRTVCF